MKVLNLNFKLLAMFAVLLVSATGTFSTVEAASTKSPFLKLAGKWRGSGRVTPPGGQPEKVRCRVSYVVSGSGNKAKQSIRCAGNGYWIVANSNLKYTPGTKKIRGIWNARFGDKKASKSKKKNRTGGAVQGDYINNVISISLINQKYTGNMNVYLNGRKQKVVINSIAVLNLKR